MNQLKLRRDPTSG
jgi:hypothetical protein